MYSKHGYLRVKSLTDAQLVNLVLRAAEPTDRLSVGERTTNYPFETFFKYLFRLNTIMTLFWYIVSTWLFVETYIWSQAPNAKLAFTDYGRYI